MGLLPGVMFRDIPVGKGFNMAKTLRNEFVHNQCNYPGPQLGSMQDIGIGGLF